MTEFRIQKINYRKNNPLEPNYVEFFYIEKKKYFLFIPYWSCEEWFNYALMEDTCIYFNTKEEAEIYLKKIKEIDNQIDNRVY